MAKSRDHVFLMALALSVILFFVVLSYAGWKYQKSKQPTTRTLPAGQLPPGVGGM